MTSRTFASTLLAIAVLAVPRDARAAGSAYQVDTAEVSEPGSCKIESWLSFADNRDFIAAATPACVANLFKPVDLSLQMVRARADQEWATALTPKAKVNLVPTAIGSFGIALSAQASFDVTAHENTALAVTVPATLRLSHNMRINLNAGWLWDRVAERHYATYGAAFDLRTSDNVWTWTAEVFGQAGAAESLSIVGPRFQTGVRFRPVEAFSIDVVYGRNISGENANWITVATVIRFAPPGR
jgi:hypothetical protein